MIFGLYGNRNIKIDRKVQLFGYTSINIFGGESHIRSNDYRIDKNPFEYGFPSNTLSKSDGAIFKEFLARYNDR